MIPAWVAPYVGIPFCSGGREVSGWDCYGAVYRIYRDVFQIELPRYEPTYGAADWPSMSAAIDQGRLDWTPILVSAAELGDVLVLRLRGIPLHVGLVIEAEPLTMLHVLHGLDTCCQRLDNPVWRPRILSAYRWTARA